MSKPARPTFGPEGVTWNVPNPQKGEPADAPKIRREYTYTISDGKGEYVAHVKVRAHGQVLWVDDLWVHTDHRRKGWGAALLTIALDDWGADDLYLAVEPYTDQPLDERQLTEWYGRFGFAPTPVPGVLRRPAGH